MAFEAQWDGVCVDCDERFQAGDYIDRQDGGYRHAGVCPVNRPVRTGSVCSTCFTEKSLTGECGCT